MGAERNAVGDIAGEAVENRRDVEHGDVAVPKGRRAWMEVVIGSIAIEARVTTEPGEGPVKERRGAVVREVGLHASSREGLRDALAQLGGDRDGGREGEALAASVALEILRGETGVHVARAA